MIRLLSIHSGLPVSISSPIRLLGVRSHRLSGISVRNESAELRQSMSFLQCDFVPCATAASIDKNLGGIRCGGWFTSVPCRIAAPVRRLLYEHLRAKHCNHFAEPCRFKTSSVTSGRISAGLIGIERFRRIELLIVWIGARRLTPSGDIFFRPTLSEQPLPGVDCHGIVTAPTLISGKLLLEIRQQRLVPTDVNRD